MSSSLDPTNIGNHSTRLKSPRVDWSETVNALLTLQEGHSRAVMTPPEFHPLEYLGKLRTNLMQRQDTKHINWRLQIDNNVSQRAIKVTHAGLREFKHRDPARIPVESNTFLSTAIPYDCPECGLLMSKVLCKSQDTDGINDLIAKIERHRAVKVSVEKVLQSWLARHPKMIFENETGTTALRDLYKTVHALAMEE